MTLLFAVLIGIGIFVGGMAVGSARTDGSKRELREQRNNARLEASAAKSALMKIAAEDTGNPALEAQLALAEITRVTNQKELN